MSFADWDLPKFKEMVETYLPRLILLSREQFLWLWDRVPHGQHLYGGDGEAPRINYFGTMVRAPDLDSMPNGKLRGVLDLRSGEPVFTGEAE